MALQAIVIPAQRYERAQRSVDFIKRYIFPGSCIPSVARITEAVATATDLGPVHLENITPHYATTLRHWRERFLANRHRVRALGFDEEFIRLWEFYLAYCEGGFRERTIGNVQMLLAKPRCALAPVLPPRRALAVPVYEGYLAPGPGPDAPPATMMDSR
jgi:cyclopropane-fatty-acyl-phospholipid synthase